MSPMYMPTTHKLVISLLYDLHPLSLTIPLYDMFVYKHATYYIAFVINCQETWRVKYKFQSYINLSNYFLSFFLKDWMFTEKLWRKTHYVHLMFSLKSTKKEQKLFQQAFLFFVFLHPEMKIFWYTRIEPFPARIW